MHGDDIIRRHRETLTWMKVVISNFSAPVERALDFRAYWARHEMPPPRPRASLFEQRVDWGFHIYAIGLYLLEKGIADSVEFWDYSEERRTFYLSNGILKVTLFNASDVAAYLDRYGDPDLFVNYGWYGHPVLALLEGRCFRVHVPTLRRRGSRQDNYGAECYLVDSEEFLDSRSMMYVPVVNLTKFRPGNLPKERDFVYLASHYAGKRHDILLDAVRGTELTGHLHPVDGAKLDLAGTRITTSDLNERDVVELLQTSRIAVYPGDHTSNPAAMWECVAAGLPIVMNERIAGGKHLVVPGVTGELAAEATFRDTMRRVLRDADRYRPREYFETHWDTVAVLESYLAFFSRMGWRAD
jgi:hypothetical protein